MLCGNLFYLQSCCYFVRTLGGRVLLILILLIRVLLHLNVQIALMHWVHLLVVLLFALTIWHQIRVLVLDIVKCMALIEHHLHLVGACRIMMLIGVGRVVSNALLKRKRIA